MSAQADNADGVRGFGLSRPSQPLVAGPVTACSCSTASEAGPAGPIMVLRIAGEIDMLTLSVVQTALDAGLAQAPQDLVVDLAGVRFCCVRGFGLLADAAHAAHASGVGFCLSGLSVHLGRVITVLWPEEHLIRYRSVAAAVTALRVEQTQRPS